ncbi:MAG: tRNA adenosine(34) deaminase TadA [Gammaproteobacteria bacterium]|nr:tRNA adenosine(34) deaminase TadA [Gammaproteobacteria bacterium]
MTGRVPDDEFWMRRALDLAAGAARAGEVPVGAVIVRDGVEIGVGANAPVRDADSTAHAEINAIRAASKCTGNYRLTGTTLYATMEPCVMCAGAIIHARIARVVYGAADERWGGAGSVFDILGCGRLNHRPVVRGGVLARQSARLLLDFFRVRRGRDGRRTVE